MALAERFEDLEIWRESWLQVKAIYEAMGHCRDLSFRDQMQRAALSVMNNIALRPVGA